MIKVGDNVRVITGSNKGKEGKVLKVFRKESFYPWDKPTWSSCMIFLICHWILFARILLRIFAFMFISDIDL